MDKTIMDINIENLKEKQYEFLKEHTLNILEGIIDDLNNDKFNDIRKKIVFSAAGDGYGDNNYYIDFSYNETSMDLFDIVDKKKKKKK